jgi:7-carboxy-7-deazaguanine synthase (Cx14CxxC type)
VKHYKVKEIYYTLQGEGAQTGRAAVFCRFTGCNLWTGHEADRHKAICQFCDTDFVGMDGQNGGRYSAEALVSKVAALWPAGADGGKPLVVCTGGEPLLQLDAELVAAFHGAGLEVAIETNGTILPPDGIDWICVSPKAGAEVVVRTGNELKLVYPQFGLDPSDFVDWQFEHFYLQPLDSPALTANTKLTIDYCLENPKWRLSLQTHKLLGLP